MGANLGNTNAPANPTITYKVPTIEYAIPKSHNLVFGFECLIIG